jgi:late competence protein required for DNA uptake (superfamily II DNA/RNA helicase)
MNFGTLLQRLLQHTSRLLGSQVSITRPVQVVCTTKQRYSNFGTRRNSMTNLLLCTSILTSVLDEVAWPTCYCVQAF